MSEFLPPGRSRYWQPNPRLVALALQNAHGVVVDLCPGSAPFPYAGAVRCGWGADETDITRDRLPFDDQSVDFLYCRHTLEDLLDPQWTLSEIARVAKSGWIETPSVMSELCRGVDAGSPSYRGYAHHRSIFWNEVDTLVTCAKYPLAEYLSVDGIVDSEWLGDMGVWNTVHCFSGPLQWKQLRHEVDYHLPHGYLDILRRAASGAIAKL